MTFFHEGDNEFSLRHIDNLENVKHSQLLAVDIDQFRPMDILCL